MPEFRPPPGWPPVPPGWLPPHGWSPDPAWPPPPPGWQFYTDSAAPRSRVRMPIVASVVGAVLALALVVVVVVRVTGHRSVDVVENGFGYRVRIVEVTRPPQAHGLIAKPGFSFLGVTVEVENRQSDRSAPAVQGARAVGVPPASTTVVPPGTPGQDNCQVGGAGPGWLSDGNAGTPAGWCFFALADDGYAASTSRTFLPGERIRQTFTSKVALPDDLDAGDLHVWTRTGAGDDAGDAAAVDLGPAD